MSEVVTGTDAIRRAVALRVKRMDYGRVAREVGIANETLVAFAEGRVQLSNERLCKLATELWQHTEFDPEQNLLRSTNRTPPQPMGIPPAPYDPEQHPSYLPDPVGGWTRGSFHLPPARRRRGPRNDRDGYDSVRVLPLTSTGSTARRVFSGCTRSLTR